LQARRCAYQRTRSGFEADRQAGPVELHDTFADDTGAFRHDQCGADVIDAGAYEDSPALIGRIHRGNEFGRRRDDDRGWIGLTKARSSRQAGDCHNQAG
jgi:hypothetical protein